HLTHRVIHRLRFSAGIGFTGRWFGIRRRCGASWWSEAKKQQAAGFVTAQVKLQIAIGVETSVATGGFVKSRAVFTLTNRNLIKVIAATILQNQRTAKAASAIRFRNRFKGY